VTGAGTFWQGAAKGSNIIGDGQGGWNLIRGKESHGHEEKGNLITGSCLGRPGEEKGSSGLLKEGEKNIIDLKLYVEG